MNTTGCNSTGGWVGDPPNPYIAPNFQQPQQPMSVWPAPGSLGFGMDPNPMFTAAINRLAAAIEKFNERGAK